MRPLVTYVRGMISQAYADVREWDPIDFWRMSMLAFDIVRHTRAKRRVLLPLFHIKPVHRLTRTRVIARMRERIVVCAKHRNDLLSEGVISDRFLRSYLPSRTSLTVVSSLRDGFYVIDGNARLDVLQKVFSGCEHMMVEVEEFVVCSPDKIVEQIESYRRYQDLR